MKSSSTSATKVIRVLIADDRPIVREGLVTILKSEKDIEVVAEAADGKETCVLYTQKDTDFNTLLPTVEDRSLAQRAFQSAESRLNPRQ
jgi:DNA-binding NarL/FixJ family response regulator